MSFSFCEDGVGTQAINLEYYITPYSIVSFAILGIKICLSSLGLLILGRDGFISFAVVPEFPVISISITS